MVVDRSLADRTNLFSVLKENRPLAVKRNKIVTAEEAVREIQNGATVAFGGFAGVGAAEEIASAIEANFLQTGNPQGLTLMFAVATGPGDHRPLGLNHLAHEGLLDRIIGGHWGLAPKIQRLAVENKVVAYNLPQGIISHMYRNVASGKAGLFSQVGLGTFVDPRNDGGRLNARTTKSIVQLMEVAGQEHLFFDAIPIDVAVIRGTTADTDGNITMEKEALTLESLSIAMAARNSGGRVIVQVERIAQAGTLNSRQVKIPGILVDHVVVACPENHWQTFGEPYNPAFSGETRVPTESIANMPMSCRKVIARRAAFELAPDSVVNLGIGLPEGVANVANEEQVLDCMTLTAEPGVIGGMPAGGINFGAAINATAVIDQPYQFDFYNGGGIDIAFLGMAEADARGNVNVSRFGSRLAGAGGFINISQNSKRIVFMGTFTAGGAEYDIADGRLTVKTEGRLNKFVDRVQHITFSGPYNARSGRRILYVTERCVFELGPEGLELIEIAPGIDLERDILGRMDFVPAIREPLAIMDPRIFRPAPMSLKDDLFTIPADDRIFYNPAENIMLANLAGFTVKSAGDVKAVKTAIERVVRPLGQKVYAVGNYDQFNIEPDLIDEYTAMQAHLVENYFLRVSRYTTNAALRHKLGAALVKRGMDPHIYESPEEAHAVLVSN